MADDFSNLQEYKKNIAGKNDQKGETKKDIATVERHRVHVIITQRKNSSWVNDLDAREKINQLNRIYH